MKWTKKGHQFDEIAKEILSYDGDYYIWGAGEKGEHLYCNLKDEIGIKGYIDSDEEINEFMELKVYHPNEVKTLDGKIIVASGAYTQIKELLLEKGLIEYVDFFGKEFAGIYYLYKLDKVLVDRFDLSVTSRCNLRCKYCCNFMPYHTKQYDLTLEETIESISNFFDKVDLVNELNLLGGETFLNKELCEILKYICENYYERIRSITIATNGTILPKPEIIDLIKKYNINFTISDYRSGMDYQKKIELFKNLVVTNNINYVIYTLDKWVDFGFPENIPQNSANQNLIQHFDICGNRCRVLVGNKYYFCHVAMSGERTGKFNGKSTDYYLIDDEFNKKEFIEFDLGYNENGYISFCTVCRGYHSNIMVDACEIK